MARFERAEFGEARVKLWYNTFGKGARIAGSGVKRHIHGRQILLPLREAVSVPLLLHAYYVL